MAAHLLRSGMNVAQVTSGDWGRESTGDMDLLMQSYQFDNPTQYQGITKGHWVPSATQCMNPGCNAKFTFTERRHHCRRCGQVFCKACTSHQRRLSVLAHPDPAGTLYKVCVTCFGDPQTLGQTRGLMDDYHSAKWASHQGAPNGHQGAALRIGTKRSLRPRLRNQLDMQHACERLMSGFLQTYNASTLRKAAQDLKGLLIKPKWQLPPNNVYEKLVPECRGCSSSFTLLFKRHFCTACGAATCTSCSTQDLIVYLPNGETFTQWAIIKIIGCPEKEPDACVYLRVCGPCREMLVQLQAHQFQKAEAEIETGDTWGCIEKIYMRLMVIERKINNQLPQYQELIDSLEISPGAARSMPNTKSNTQVLAKAQSDLSDHFSQLVMIIQEVKSNKPATRGQASILRNILKSKCNYYQENMFTFRELKRRLETITPLEVLTVIQGIVDRNAINSCYLSIKQLLLELLHLSLTRGAPDTLMIRLTPLEQVALEDLQASVVRAREDWDDHLACVNQLLQLQLKNHRLMRLSSQLTPDQVEGKVCDRVAHILRQVQLQLTAKCADRSFPKTKAALESALEEVQGS